MITRIYQGPKNEFEISFSLHSHHAEFKVIRKLDMPDAVYLEGSVKWDGCSNWKIHDEVMFHACDQQDIMELSHVMLQCRSLTQRFLKTWVDI